jgi:hypothetical protein
MTRGRLGRGIYLECTVNDGDSSWDDHKKEDGGEKSLYLK